MKRGVLHSLSMLILALSGSCLGGPCNEIPNVSFRESFDQADIPSGYGMVSGGVCGLLITRYSGRYYAFDRCSTVKPEERNLVNFETSLTFIDPKSGAKWMLTEQGAEPTLLAECPLKQYSVNQQGNVYYVEF